MWFGCIFAQPELFIVFSELTLTNIEQWTHVSQFTIANFAEGLHHEIATGSIAIGKSQSIVISHMLFSSSYNYYH